MIEGIRKRPEQWGQISRLRRKIDRDFSPPLLHTLRGAGHMLSADA